MFETVLMVCGTIGIVAITILALFGMACMCVYSVQEIKAMLQKDSTTEQLESLASLVKEYTDSYLRRRGVKCKGEEDTDES